MMKTIRKTPNAMGLLLMMPSVGKFVMDMFHRQIMDSLRLSF